MITLDVTDDAVPEVQRLSPEIYEKIATAVSNRFIDIEGTVGVSYVNDEKIRRLNRMYRQKDAVTDVLSFASDFSEQTSILGDVIISFDQAVRQAEDGDIELELVDLIVHGILHVLGFDHETAEEADEMFPIQDELIAKTL